MGKSLLRSPGLDHKGELHITALPHSHSIAFSLCKPLHHGIRFNVVSLLPLTPSPQPYRVQVVLRRIHSAEHDAVLVLRRSRVLRLSARLRPYKHRSEGLARAAAIHVEGDEHVARGVHDVIEVIGSQLDHCTVEWNGFELVNHVLHRHKLLVLLVEQLRLLQALLHARQLSPQRLLALPYEDLHHLVVAVRRSVLVSQLHHSLHDLQLLLSRLLSITPSPRSDRDHEVVSQLVQLRLSPVQRVVPALARDERLYASRAASCPTHLVVQVVREVLALVKPDLSFVEVGLVEGHVAEGRHDGRSEEGAQIRRFKAVHFGENHLLFVLRMRSGRQRNVERIGDAHELSPRFLALRVLRRVEHDERVRVLRLLQEGGVGIVVEMIHVIGKGLVAGLHRNPRVQIESVHLASDGSRRALQKQSVLGILRLDVDAIRPVQFFVHAHSVGENVELVLILPAQTHIPLSLERIEEALNRPELLETLPTLPSVPHSQNGVVIAEREFQIVLCQIVDTPMYHGEPKGATIASVLHQNRREAIREEETQQALSLCVISMEGDDSNCWGCGVADREVTLPSSLYPTSPIE